ncbi:MAG TPA: RNA polymerase sigma factor [Phycisphaerales bacterium]|nr:RNA polymerase sigma factor [Phycisphaerales bacterium]
MTIQPPSAAFQGGPALGGLGEFERGRAPELSDAADDPSERGNTAPAHSTDEHLLATFLNGDAPSLGALAQRHERHLLGLATGLLHGRRDLALDAVQDTWLRVIKYGRSFRSGSTVKTWLYRILVNTCKDVRTRSYKLNTQGGAGSSPPVEHLPDATPSPSPDTPTQSHIRAAIESLPGDHRLLILLCYHNGLTHPQAAEVLNIPVGTLKSRLHTALNLLRKSLQESPERELTSNTAASAPREQSP